MEEKVKKCRWNVAKNIKIICDGIVDSKLRPVHTQEYDIAVEKMCQYFDCTEQELWIIAYASWYYFSNGNEKIVFREFGEFVSTNILNIVQLVPEFESLSERNIIEFDTTNMAFQISKPVIQSIIKNIQLPKKLTSDYSYSDFLKDFAEKFEGRRYSELSPSEVMENVQKIENTHENLPLIVRTRSIIPDDATRFIFYDVCSDFLKGFVSQLSPTLEDIYSSTGFMIIARQFLDRTHPLIKNEILEFDQRGTLADTTVTLTEKGKKILLDKDYDLYESKLDEKTLLLPENIKGKNLFYSKETQKQIDMIKEALEPGKLKDIRERLDKEGLPCGINIIFHGLPGTGKTESVYQIAKQTGRAIVHVDISQTKSCWFGESEKKIKDIFIKYRAMCKNELKKENGRIPIILFNEADAIFGKRKDISFSNTAQTENAIQNIILEEMEKLPGILIATTNLTDNLDPAFERRFLFKVRFDNPTTESKKAIWLDKLTWLDDKNASIFATTYDFSGGEIDNIVRKITMKEVVSGTRPAIQEIDEMCKVEKLAEKEMRKVGFVA